jgi:hypothetical protein
MKLVRFVFAGLCFFMVSILAGCSLFNAQLNKADSVENICTVSKDDYDYSFNIRSVGKGYRIEKKREVHIGNRVNGLEYDGKNAYRYINNSRITMSEFPFETYDSRADEILLVSQKILSEGYYTAYNDESFSYRNILYHFQISQEGLSLFRDQNYTYGMIDCVYNNGVFEHFNVDLYEDNNDSPVASYTFGRIHYTISYY